MFSYIVPEGTLKFGDLPNTPTKQNGETTEVRFQFRINIGISFVLKNVPL